MLCSSPEQIITLMLLMLPETIVVIQCESTNGKGMNFVYLVS